MKLIAPRQATGPSPGTLLHFWFFLLFFRRRRAFPGDAVLTARGADRP
jgi:hypothetical protein